VKLHLLLQMLMILRGLKLVLVKQAPRISLLSLRSVGTSEDLAIPQLRFRLRRRMFIWESG